MKTGSGLSQSRDVRVLARSGVEEKKRIIIFVASSCFKENKV